MKAGVSETHLIRRALEALVVMTGIGLLAGAVMAGQSWWDDHFLPLFFYSREKHVFSERLARLAVALSGVFLIFAIRPAVRRAISRAPAADIFAALARILLAAGLALAVSEWTLGHGYRFAAAERQPGEEPLRQPDSMLGWVFAPSHNGRSVVGGRKISYSTDAHGYRVRDRGTAVDFSAPSLVFTGESIISGYGLNWEETIPAQTAALLKTQSVSMAVFGYANDQAYLRLQAELPRFRRPAALVSLFMPPLLARNLGDDRPHLGPGLNWRPARHYLRLNSLINFLVPYHGKAEIERGIQTTRAILLATAALACRRHAMSLVVDPQYGQETPVEQMLRRRILEQSGVDYLKVSLDPAWHLQGDLHPDPRAAHAIAAAIAARLKADLGRRSENCGSGPVSAWAGAPR